MAEQYNDEAIPVNDNVTESVANDVVWALDKAEVVTDRFERFSKIMGIVGFMNTIIDIFSNRIGDDDSNREVIEKGREALKTMTGLAADAYGIPGFAVGSDPSKKEFSFTDSVLQKNQRKEENSELYNERVNYDSIPRTEITRENLSKELKKLVGSTIQRKMSRRPPRRARRFRAARLRTSNWRSARCTRRF